MSLWALIQDGRVATIVDSGSMPTRAGQWVNVDGLGIGPGYIYDGASFAPPRKVYTNIDTEAFWERFTQAELVAYDVAMQHDPAAGNPAKKAAAKLRIFRRDASDAGYRNLTKPKVRTFVQELEAASDTMGGTILAVGRATVILDTPITVDEAYGQHTP